MGSVRTAPGSPPPTRCPTHTGCGCARGNGELRQDWSTADLIFTVPELLAFIAQTCTLEAGTLILTGTPSGVGVGMDPQVFLARGDTVRVEIEGLGAIEHPIA